MLKISKQFAFVPLLSIFALIACSNGEEKPAAATPGNPSESAPPVVEITEPVTLKMFLSAANQEVFQAYVEPPLKAKYPNIKLEYLAQKPGLPELVAAGTIPDFINSQSVSAITQLDLQEDLMPLIKKHRFDIRTIDPNLVESVRGYSSKGELFGLPAGSNTQVAMYNKDIFDKFAVPYPKDGMTWDQIIELSKKLTRLDAGIQYRGFHPGIYEVITGELSLRFFDKNGKASLTTADWQKASQVWKSIFEASKNDPANVARTQFQQEKTTAMILTNPSFLIRNPDPGINWDMVSAPTFAGGPGPDQLGQMFFIPKTSKNKDAAFIVLSVFYSDEVQTAINKDGALISNSTKPEIQKAYGANIKEVQGKNLQAVFHNKGAVLVVEENEEIANPIVTTAFKAMVTGGKDINTALREAEEQIDLKVKDLNAR